MHSSITFKPYEEKYLSKGHEIYSYYILHSTATCQISPISLDEMRKILEPESPRYKTFVILSGETMIGYVLFTRFKTREAYDNTAEVTIYLQHDCTGQGIGNAALQLIEKEALDAGVHALVALISSDNEASLRLFDKNGYTRCAEFKEVSFKFNHYFGLTCSEKVL